MDSQVNVYRQLKVFNEFEQFEIPKIRFKRVVLEVIKGRKWKTNAVEALQYAAEFYLENMFRAAGMCSNHANRATLTVKDIRLARKIRGEE